MAPWGDWANVWEALQGAEDSGHGNLLIWCKEKVGASEAQPQNVVSPEAVHPSLLDVRFLAARHPGARKWGWGRVRWGVSATVLSKQIYHKISWGRLD